MRLPIAACFVFCFGLLGAWCPASEVVDLEVDWEDFMGRHDLLWERLPSRWEEAPYLGNGNIGTMIYFDKSSGALRMQLFRVDVQDHRDNSFGWTAYSRPRLMIGSFHLKTVGKITDCDWRLDLHDATLRGTLTTDRGSLSFEHLVHTRDMVISTEFETSGEESGAVWEWKPEKAATTRPGYPKNGGEIKGFAERYGKHYLETLKIQSPNPDPVIEKRGASSVSIQNLHVGGQYAVAWEDRLMSENSRALMVSIEKSFPEMTAADDAVASVKRVLKSVLPLWKEQHRNWWHDYYAESFVSIPDTRLESFYWHQIYKMACATRADRPMMDTAGPWIQPTPWPYITWDLNVQLCYWPVAPANRLHLGDSLIDTLHNHRQNLIRNVRPVEWQEDSAYVPVTTAQDLIEPRDADMRYFDCVGNLPWAMHNCWLLYRHQMDDEMLREKIFPLLKRSINLYRHLLIEGDDGKLHLPVTYSPEVGHAPDCNYDLALLMWGCGALLESTERLGIDDPLIPVWKDIRKRLVDFPVDENGFMIGAGKPWNVSHRHFSHLLMAYPLYLVNVDQGPEAKALIEKSLKHWVSFKGALQGYSYTGASSISSAIGNGDEALEYLKGLERFLQPNGLYKESGPVMETPLSAAQSIHDMLLQSWNRTLRVFPATPSAWQDVSFHDMRADGAFLISAVRKGGETKWVRIKSLAGEPCTVKPSLTGKVRASGGRDFKLTEMNYGVYSIDLKKGEEVLLWSGDEEPRTTILPVVGDETKMNSFGLKEFKVR